MDSLLDRAVRPDGAADDDLRVNQLMGTLRAETLASARSTEPASVSSRRLWRWVPIPLAAGLLVAVLFLTQPGGSKNAAQAALDRTIAAEQKPEAREYAVTIVARRSAGSTRKSRHRLFVKQRDFAISRSRLFGSGEVWMGGSGDTRWLVPGIGPVLVGGRDLLRKQLPGKQIVETPFMSVARILERTRRFYDLAHQPQVSLRMGDRLITCQHIVGTRIQTNQTTIPQQVEVWADVNTGFAQRVRLSWKGDDKSRWLEATAELVGTPSLPADFFEHTAHHDADRRVIQKK